MFGNAVGTYWKREEQREELHQAMRAVWSSFTRTLPCDVCHERTRKTRTTPWQPEDPHICARCLTCDNHKQ